MQKHSMDDVEYHTVEGKHTLHPFVTTGSRFNFHRSEACIKNPETTQHQQGKKLQPLSPRENHG
jgi:hypothetical protein